MLEKEFEIEAIKDFQSIELGGIQAIFPFTKKLKKWIYLSSGTSRKKKKYCKFAFKILWLRIKIINT